MASKRVAIVTVDEVEPRQYRVVSVYFTNVKAQGSAFHTYHEEILTGAEVFKLIEKLAKNNGYILERNTDFGVNVPRILLQHINNPGVFSIPYSL